MVKRSLAFGGILAILSGVGIYNNIYAATEGTTKFSVDVNNAVLELTIPSTPAVIDLNPTMTNTSFGSTSINVHVATNNQTGYTLTMTPTNSQEDTSLIRTELIGDEEEYREIETLEQTDPISTGYTEQTFTANAWGYKITGYNYYGIDPNNTTVSHPAWTTSAPTNGIDHNLTLAAKVDADTVSGAYETTLNFYAVTNAVPLVTLEMSYGFHGKQKVAVGNEEYYKMQDMTTEICSYTNEIPSELQVVDVRDGTIYHIGKLADNRCWMLDNLALDPVDPNVQAQLSPTNTNATQAAIDNYTTGSGTAPQPGWTTTAVSYVGGNMTYHLPQININSKDITRASLTNPSDKIEEADEWKFGVYYNYCAASIGTYCEYYGTPIDKPNTAIDVEYDICPIGWRMPTGGSNDSQSTYYTDFDGGEYQTLRSAYPANNGGDKYYVGFRKVFHLPLSGHAVGNDPREQGYSGFFWSATNKSNAAMYVLRATIYDIASTAYENRVDLMSMRCIAK